MPIEQARKAEPMITGQDGSEVLWSPNTAVVNNMACLNQLQGEVQNMNPNFEVILDSEYLRNIQGKKQILTKKQEIIEYSHLVNCAGLQSLQIAQSFDQVPNLASFPMKGLYLQSKRPLGDLYHSLVYPIPLPGAYTLGVHSTIAPSGHMKIGPTTSPAFSLENYNGI